MGIITSLFGIVCILYYIAGVRYAGYRVSGLWIWLAAGIGWMVWGGCRIGCAVAGVPFFVPGALVAIVRVCLLAGLVLFFYLEHQIGTGMKAKGIENLDYIVVLGCQVKRIYAGKSGDDCGFIRRAGKNGGDFRSRMYETISGESRNQQGTSDPGTKIHHNQTESSIQQKIYGLST